MLRMALAGLFKRKLNCVGFLVASLQRFRCGAGVCEFVWVSVLEQERFFRVPICAGFYPSCRCGYRGVVSMCHVVGAGLSPI